MIDGKCLLPPRAGVARYLEGLLGALAGLPHPDLTIDVLAPAKPRRTAPWVLLDMRRATARADLAHFPFYYPPFAPHCPVVVAVHDVLVLEHPEWFRPRFGNTLRALIPGGARRAAAVVTGCECIRKTIVERCGVPAARVRVIPYGLDHGLFRPPLDGAVAAVRRRLGLGRPYLLQVGALEPRRGVDLAVQAVAALRAAWPELELVLVGTPRAPVAALTDPPAWLRRLGRVEDRELPALYAGSELVLAPSRGEGFDFPVLEALACGAAVVASDIPVHVEQFGPAVRLFESGRPDALAGAAGPLLGDEAARAALRAAGPPHAAGFTWRRSAELHLELWREVAGR